MTRLPPTTRIIIPIRRYTHLLPRPLLAHLPLRSSFTHPFRATAPTLSKPFHQSTKTFLPNQTDHTPDSSNVWKTETDNDSAYWDLYLATRPNYTSLFSQINAYHAAHSTSFSTAIDVGCGAGQSIPILAQRFAHVIATDNNEAHIVESKRRLADLPKEKVSYAISAGEDLSSHFLAGSMDLITAAECMPLMDTDAAVAGFAKLLRPGGALAMWFYGKPRFVEAVFVDKCQPLLEKILTLSFKKVVYGGGPEKRAAWQRAMRGMESWLDDVALPEEQWGDVKRTKWNTHARLPFFEKEACDFPVERVSRVGKGEEVEEVKDDAFWERKWDFEGVNGFIQACFPGVMEMQAEDEEIQQLLSELREGMGGEVRRFTWPAVLVLATRRAG